MDDNRVKIKVEHKTIVECPIPATNEETQQFSDHIALVVRSGERLTRAATLTGGNRTYPYVTGIRLTFGS